MKIATPIQSSLPLPIALGLMDVPAAPAPTGYAFAEVVGDAGLAALGFTRTGLHRSKPVELWTQGEARVLVNAEGERGRIGALGVTVPDPIAAAQRAEVMLAPSLARLTGPGEASLTAIAAPDGTQIFFCSDHDWIDDFIPTGETENGVGITGLDHVALTQPFDHFDEATLFYRSVLGLEPGPVTEFAAPYGLVRCRGVSGDGIRLSLDAALVRRGEWAPAVKEPQHIAFTCTDAVASAEALRLLGARLLEIPGNYYDDLAARTGLPPRRINELREHSVLYDHDDRGEFLHFHTELAGGRVFFEVVQRIGDYRGFGVVNAPVQMAAHHDTRRRASVHQPLGVSG